MLSGGFCFKFRCPRCKLGNVYQDEGQQIGMISVQMIDELRLFESEFLLGKIFYEIGFFEIIGTMVRHLVPTRLSFSVSKLNTTDYLFKDTGDRIAVDNVYRYLDKLHHEQEKYNLFQI